MNEQTNERWNLDSRNLSVQREKRKRERKVLARVFHHLRFTSHVSDSSQAYKSLMRCLSARCREILRENDEKNVGQTRRMTRAQIRAGYKESQAQEFVHGWKKSSEKDIAEI